MSDELNEEAKKLREQYARDYGLSYDMQLIVETAFIKGANWAMRRELDKQLGGKGDT